MAPARRKSTRARTKVQKANKVSSSELKASLDSATLAEQHKKLSFEVFAASEFSPEDRNEIWSILENNMKDAYARSSFGWKPVEKQAELFHELSRFIVVRNTPEVSSTSVPATIVAYSMFRFEVEERKDVVYCYEVQVHQQSRRSGLGGCLMKQLVSIGKRWKMQMIMLTVFKSNVAARSLYNALGFEVDPTSPEYPDSGEEGSESSDEEREEYDYEILSLPID
ncbi:acyl-CoA N-acyltransferase [Rhodofomes roseus]|uniref:N-alpha-acetyltransferase 40 n=1 Tax=Rhodofomes roseus TaxID=34475 RepID=A0ABQ8KH84_9APHY|nr:acyl-CoA N-acyltransferase [Rhodofomes roseus]KAH9837104.1 acyl-CoA N-acyltransferase [Rhodofomes roseus]